MELNTAYYNDLTNVRGFSVTPLLTNVPDSQPFPVNAQFDESASYAIARGRYCPYYEFSTNVLGGVLGDYSKKYSNTNGYVRRYLMSDRSLNILPNPNINIGDSRGSGNFPYNAGIAEHMVTSFGGYGDNSNSNSSKWAYNVNSEGGMAYYGYGFVCKFAYTRQCAYVTVTGYDAELNQYTTSPLGAYDFLNYPNVSTIQVDVLIDDGADGRIASNAGIVYDWEYEYSGLYTEGPLGATYASEKTLLPNAYGLKGTSASIFGGYVHYNKIPNQRNTTIQPAVSSLPQLSECILKDGFVYMYIPNCTYDTICRIVSTFGLYFADDRETARTAVLGENCTDPKVHLGVMSEGGFYEGNYKSGADTATLPQAQWTDRNGSWYADNGVQPSPDTNNYVDEMELNTPAITTIGAFNRTYAMNKTNLNILSDYLWNADEDLFNQIVESLKLFGENPMNAIIDIRLYPFDILSKSEHSTTELIKLGRIVTDVQGIKLTNATNCIVDLGSCNFREYFKNFLDFDPYTSATLYIPYVGTMSLPPEKYLGHTVSVKLIVDFTTGACTAVVFSDGIITAYQAGTVGIEISMSGSVSATTSANALNGTISGVGKLAGGVAGVATGNIGGLLGIAGGASSIVSGFAQPTPIQTVGSGTSATAMWQPQACYLLIESPIVNAPTGYGHNIGYACEFTTTLENVSGFTVCTNMYFDMQYTSRPNQVLPTTAQRDEICKLLNSGVYL